MTNPNPSSGGMPKWLIILLVILLVMILGCCGGISTCVYYGYKKGRSAVAQAIQDAKDREARRSATPSAADGIPAAPAADGTPAAPTGIPAAPADGGANAAPTAAAPAAGPLGAAKFPANFPKDVPVLNGLTPAMSSSDNANSGGMVMMSGKVKTDDAVTYYTQALPKQGYTQVSNNSFNDATVLVFSKDSLQVSVQILPGDAGASTSSNVIITYEKK